MSNNFKVWNTPVFGDVTSDLNDSLNIGVYRYNINTLNIPFNTSYGSCLTLFANEEKNVIAQIAQNIAKTNRACLYVRGYENDVWTPWQQQDAIVAKSLGEANGYITYASGLILQWGSLRSFDSGDGTNTWLSKPLPILFSNGSYCIVATNANNIIGEVRVAPRTQNTYSVSRSSTNLTYYSYFAISH